jgi:transposase
LGGGAVRRFRGAGPSRTSLLTTLLLLGSSHGTLYLPRSCDARRKAGSKKVPGEGRRSYLEAKSSTRRMAPSTGVQGSDGIQRRSQKRCPRIDKEERDHRLRGSPDVVASPKRSMKFIGIDIASEKHVVAVVDPEGTVLVKPTPFTEDLPGYEKLLGLIGPAEQALVALEATGHYWQNLFATLVASGFAVALLNPLRTRRFAEVDMPRVKTDSVDALSIAKFAVEKRPPPTALPDDATLELRELVRLRDRYVQDLGDRVRQLHRALDLTFPEFTKLVSSLESALATTLLTRCQTAMQFATQPLRQLSRLVYDGSHQVGEGLAKQLIQTARVSVGKHHGAAYRRQVEEFCADIATFRRRIRELDEDIRRTLKRHETGMLLTTIDASRAAQRCSKRSSTDRERRSPPTCSVRPS